MLDSIYNRTLELLKQSHFWHANVKKLSSFVQCYNIGITHVFRALTFAGPRKLFEHEAVRLSVQTSSEGPSKS